MHDPTVAHDDETGPLAGLGRDRAAAGRAFVAGLAELLRRDRTEPIEIEIADPAVAPDLLLSGGPTQIVELLRGRTPSLGEPIGAGECSRRVGRERTH